jgi:hypothetical protein
VSIFFSEPTEKKYILRFGVITVVKMSTVVFWVVTPRGLVGRYQP